MPASRSSAGSGGSARSSEGYTGRFAPSPTGPLHRGSVVAALASWLDARAAAAAGLPARWLVRIEDLDKGRCPPDSAETILAQLQCLGLHPDEKPVWQTRRTAFYEQALQELRGCGSAYACSCSRKEIEEAWQARGMPRRRFETLIYPGTCRHGGPAGPVRAWRFAVGQGGAGEALVHWEDRRCGPQQQDVAREVGDFALLRADGVWSYQLACVVDDARQGVTHVVRGEDLLDNTPRQLLLQRALGLATPVYLHTPLALDERGEKLSKSNHAPCIDMQQPLQELLAAAAVLQLPVPTDQSGIAAVLAFWVQAWSRRWPLSV